jgi:hypothetical protein
MEQFRLALEICNLSDLGFKGPKLTWKNRRGDKGYIKERLDRVLANNEWIGLFEEVSVQVMAERLSNHKPLLVRIMKEREERVPFQKGFKFEASWLMDKEYNNIIKDWAHGHANGTTKTLNMLNKLEAMEYKKIRAC